MACGDARTGVRRWELRRRTMWRLVGGMIAAGLCGCEMPWESDDGPEADKTPDGSSGVNVAGTWTYKTETMVLMQQGTKIDGITSVDGFRQDAANPVKYPVPTVGGVLPDGRVRLEEEIIFLKSPHRNYEVEKVGRLTDPNTLVLEVVSGQSPHTQVWKRKSG